jgi:hypothetical protein
MKYPANESFGALCPELVKLWHPTRNDKLTPYDIGRGSCKEVWWMCEKGHEWPAIVYSMYYNNKNKRVKKQYVGCPYCGGKKTNKENCLANTFPDIAKEWHPTKNGKLTPYDVTKGSTKKIWWKCKKGHEWPTTPNIRTCQHTGCPYCNGFRLDRQHNLAIAFPEIAKEWHPTKNGKLTPYDVTPLTNRVVWWKCYRGHEWPTRVCHRVRGSSNCPCCSKIQLKDGSFFYSLAEAFWYLRFKKMGLKFSCNKRYSDGVKNFGKRTYDFYFPRYNLYVETTGFNKEWKHWKKYWKKIKAKKRYVEKTLGGQFLFVQYFLTEEDRKLVQSNMKNS